MGPQHGSAAGREDRVFGPQKLFSMTSQRDAAGHWVAVPAVMPAPPLSGDPGTEDKGHCGLSDRQESSVPRRSDKSRRATVDS